MPGLRWKSTALAALRRDYEAGALPVNDVAAVHGTSRGNLMRLAKRHGWRRRQADRLPPEAHALWNTYRNKQRWHGRAIALEIVAAAYLAATDGAAALPHAQAAAIPATGHLPRPVAAHPALTRTHRNALHTSDEIRAHAQRG